MSIALASALHVDGAGANETIASWPQVRLPDNVSVFPIGDRVTVSGMPMRIAGFVSSEPPDRLLPALRRSLGEPLVQSVSGDRHLLGRAEGRFYLTVQVIATAEGSRGIVSTTDVRTAADRKPALPDNSWINRLPSGSTVSSDVSSEDAGRTARHRVVINGHAEAVNRDAVLRMMQDEGYRLERETRADAAGQRKLPAQFADAAALYFTGPAKQAVVVIVRDRDRTAVIVQTDADSGAGR